MPEASPASPLPQFEMTFPVENADIDFMGHVNNAVYLRWVQDIATSHWQHLASAEAQKTILWVVTRHEIDYRTAAILGDEVLAKTWVGPVSGLAFERHTEMRRARDGELLVTARTLWIPINAQTHRPQRPNAEIRALFSSDLTGS